MDGDRRTCERRCRKASARSASSPPSKTRTLPPDLLESGARRLGLLALLTAFLVVFMPLFFRHVDRVLGRPAGHPALMAAAMIAGAAMSLAIGIVVFRRLLPPVLLLDVALIYEVAQALAISILFHLGSYSALPPRGWTSVAVWVLVFPLIVPTTRGKAALATVAAAAMDPLGLGVTVLAGNAMPRPALLAQLFIPTAVGAAVALLLSGVLYRLGAEVGEAREMGSYRLVQLLGQGGMGEVWLAEHRMLARPAAIKLIAPDPHRGLGRELARRFEREARATAALRSPHTVQIYDFGTNEDGAFYYVMELLNGYDLETLVARFGPVPPARAVALLRQACHSLAEAHRQGLIHRDVKPANIYVCQYGIESDFVKLLDFGLVKDADPALTRDGVIAGSPAFMAPEIASGGGEVDGRADLYSLGCVGYWLLTGKPPFDHTKVMQVILDQINTLPVPPSRRAPQPVPQELERIILDCLAKNPDERPETAGELSRRLAATGLEEAWPPGEAERWWREHAPALPASSPAAAASRR